MENLRESRSRLLFSFCYFYIILLLVFILQYPTYYALSEGTDCKKNCMSCLLVWLPFWNVGGRYKQTGETR